jgi:hypothetical protein
LFVREAKNLKSLCDEESISSLVRSLTLGKIVTLAVELDNQLCGVRNEVSYVISDRDLTSKAQPVNSMCPDVTPKQRLSARQRMAKFLRATVQDRAYS